MTHQQEMNYQANQIEMVLASYRLPGRICGGMVTPRLLRFHFIPQLGTRLSRLKALSEEIALSLGVSSCHIYRQEGAIQIDIPREDGAPVRLLPLCARLPTVPPCSPVLGLAAEGFPLLLSLPSPEVSHVLVSGMTGSGKTVLARAMITSLVLRNHQRNLQLVLVDLKRRGFGVFRQLPHLLVPVVEDADAALAVFRRLQGEMERRDAERIAQPRITIFIDELAELMMAGGSEVGTILTRLMQRGREAGLHVVACTQKPLAQVIGSLVKANFPVRGVGKVASAEDARGATGISGSGAETLAGKGDFVVIAGGRQIRVQAALVTEPEIREVIHSLRRPVAAPHSEGLASWGSRIREAIGRDGK